MREFSEVVYFQALFAILVYTRTYYLQYFSVLIALTHRTHVYQFSLRALRQQAFIYTNISI
jgi:hypothetical protein